MYIRLKKWVGSDVFKLRWDKVNVLHDFMDLKYHNLNEFE